MSKSGIFFYIIGIKGLSVLKETHARYPELIKTVIFGRDRKIHNDYSEEIISYCTSHLIPCFNSTDKYEDSADYSFAISWKWIIDKKKGRLIIFHDSILPKYRGFNPLVSYLINGEKEIGATAIFATEKYDEGDIISISKRSISYPIKINEAISIISECYIEIMLNILHKIKNKIALVAIPQDRTSATYSLWRDENDYTINWEKSSNEIKRFIDATDYPYLCAKTKIGDEVIRVTGAEVENDRTIENRTPGKVIYVENSYPIVVCRNGLLKITSAHFCDSKKTAIPLKNFRTRFI